MKDFVFNHNNPSVLHLDINSCFATIEQQANPFLRGKPIVVAAYDSPSGCIVAPSAEAKKLGMKVGMRVKEARLIDPKVIVVTPDPPKYRAVHLRLRKILEDYAPSVVPKSIDEFVLDLKGTPLFERLGVLAIAKEIKNRINTEVGEWIRVSVGIAPNRYLAKTAAGMQKPDGLVVIDHENVDEKYQQLALRDLCGIKTNNIVRLNSVGIFTVADFFQANLETLKAAFQSVVGYYWYMRLKGYEVDDVVFARRSYSNSFSPPQALVNLEEIAPILQKLTEKMSFRMRRGGYVGRGVHVSVLYRDYSFWHQGQTQTEVLFDGRDIYKVAYKLLSKSVFRKPVHTLAVSAFGLEKKGKLQLSLVADVPKKDRLVKAVDTINETWGDFVVSPLRMLSAKSLIADRIAFGGIKELEEFILQDTGVTPVSHNV